MDIKKLPPADLLRQLLDYDPATGAFVWRVRTDTSLFANNGARNTPETLMGMWNRKWAGKAAFCTVRHGYYGGKLLGGHYPSHRVAWAYHYGDDPDGMIDHINGDTLDNRIENLRVVDRFENARNCAIQRNNRTGHNGVALKPASAVGYKRFVAHIRHNGKQHFLGDYFTLEEAIAARRGAEMVTGVYHPNHGRERVRPIPHRVRHKG